MVGGDCCWWRILGRHSFR